MCNSQFHDLSSTLIILAPNGARKMKKDHPALPVTPDEIANDVATCVNAGAAMVHLHARTKSGEHTLNIDDNRLVFDAVKKRIGNKAVIQLTTESVGQFSPEEQMRLITEIKPEAASFALMELIPKPSYESKAADFFHTIAKKKIFAQYILYSPQQVSYYLDLLQRQILPDYNHHILIVLGRYHAQQQSQPSDLDEFVEFIPLFKTIRWAVCAFGKDELACLSYAAQLGGDTRVGFENNLYSIDGKLAKNNSEQVIHLKNTLLNKGKKLITADEARSWIK